MKCCLCIQIIVLYNIQLKCNEMIGEYLLLKCGLNLNVWTYDVLNKGFVVLVCGLQSNEHFLWQFEVKMMTKWALLMSKCRVNTNTRHETQQCGTGRGYESLHYNSNAMTQQMAFGVIASREMAQDFKTDLRFQSSAVMALQEVSNRWMNCCINWLINCFVYWCDW